MNEPKLEKKNSTKGYNYWTPLTEPVEDSENSTVQIYKKKVRFLVPENKSDKYSKQKTRERREQQDKEDGQMYTCLS